MTEAWSSPPTLKSVLGSVDHPTEVGSSSSLPMPLPLYSILDSKPIIQLAISALTTAAFVGALGWECCYNLPHDLRLLFGSTAWLRSPLRILSRLAYICCRYFALASLMLNISYWYFPHDGSDFCEKATYLIESLMCASYLSTLIILMLRTIALYPTSRLRDWAVFCITLAMLLISVGSAAWLPFNIVGGRIPMMPSRCYFVQNHAALALRLFLYSAVAFDVTVLTFTIVKLFTSGSYRFFSRKTIIGRLWLRDNLKDEDHRDSSLTKIAADLIAQGLYDFTAITCVAIGGLIAYCLLDVVLYKAMTLDCVATISAALAGGVFRETARAASTMKAIHEAGLLNESETQHHQIGDLRRRDEAGTSVFSSQGSTVDSEKHKKDVALDGRTSLGRQTSLKSLRILRGDDMSIDFGSLNTSTAQQSSSTTVIGALAGTLSLPVSHDDSDPERFVKKMTPAQSQLLSHSRRQEDFQLSLKAFDDGDRRSKGLQQEETLGRVSVIGGCSEVTSRSTTLVAAEDGRGRNCSIVNRSNPGLSPCPRSHSRAKMVKEANRV